MRLKVKGQRLKHIAGKPGGWEAWKVRGREGKKAKWEKLSLNL